MSSKKGYHRESNNNYYGNDGERHKKTKTNNKSRSSMKQNFRNEWKNYTGE